MIKLNDLQIIKNNFKKINRINIMQNNLQVNFFLKIKIYFKNKMIKK